MLTVTADSLVMQSCSMLPEVTSQSTPCFNVGGTEAGGSCLGAGVRSLVLEDCTFVAGNGARLVRDFLCGLPRSAPVGGTAVSATAVTTILTRCRFVDGNGGHTADDCNGTLARDPAGAGSSRVSGRIFAYDVVHEPGLPGLDPRLPNRLPPVNLGAPVAPLTAAGGQLGGMLTITLRADPMSPPQWVPVGFLIGFGVAPLDTPFGALLTMPLAARSVSPQGNSVGFFIPADPSLLDVVVAAQCVLAGPLLGNAGIAVIHR
jgi:hypothetical protein